MFQKLPILALEMMKNSCFAVSFYLAKTKILAISLQKLRAKCEVFLLSTSWDLKTNDLEPEALQTVHDPCHKLLKK